MMYLHLNRISMFHRRNIIRHLLLFLQIIFLSTCLSFEQAKKEKIDINDMYHVHLKEHLFPKIDTLGAKEIVLFYAKPSFEPEYSVRIVMNGNQSYIEGRLLKKNLWNEIQKYYMAKDEKSISVNVDLSSMPISNEFKERMIDVFDNLLTNNKEDESNELVFDGVSYVFCMFDKNGNSHSLETIAPRSGTIEDNLANILLQVANDLTSNSFDETKYIAKLKSL